jgi:hypothetical protein
VADQASQWPEMATSPLPQTTIVSMRQQHRVTSIVQSNLGYLGPWRFEVSKPGRDIHFNVNARRHRVALASLHQAYTNAVVCPTPWSLLSRPAIVHRIIQRRQGRSRRSKDAITEFVTRSGVKDHLRRRV